jgi:hypothetical protein
MLRSEHAVHTEHVHDIAGVCTGTSTGGFWCGYLAEPNPTGGMNIHGGGDHVASSPGGDANFCAVLCLFVARLFPDVGCVHFDC